MERGVGAVSSDDALAVLFVVIVSLALGGDAEVAAFGVLDLPLIVLAEFSL